MEQTNLHERLKTLGVDPMVPQVYVLDARSVKAHQLQEFVSQWRSLTLTGKVSKDSVVIASEAPFDVLGEFSYTEASRILLQIGKGCKLTRKKWFDGNELKKWLGGNSGTPYITYDGKNIWYNPNDGFQFPMFWQMNQDDLTANDWMLYAPPAE